MAWTPIAAFVPQWVDSNGDPYSGAVLKAYQEGTTTNINFATDNSGGTQVTDIVLNASGYPAVSGSIITPHLNEKAKVALYPTQAAADADTGAIWSVDSLGFEAIYHPRTAAEVTAGVTPTNYEYEPGNVLRYGAVGDGATNDTTAINNALSVAQSVFFPGTANYYLTSAALVAGVAGQEIKGEGYRSYIRCNTADINVLTITSLAGVKVEGLRFRANGSSGGDTLGNCILGTTVTDCVFTDLWVENSRNGIYLRTNSARCLIENLFSQNHFTQYGVLVTGCDDITVSSSSFTTTTSQNEAIQFNIESTTHNNRISVENCVIDMTGTTSTTCAGISFRYVDSGSITGNVIDSATGAKANGTFGIIVNNSTEIAATGNRVSGGTPTQVASGSVGMYAGDTSEYVTFAGNIIENATVGMQLAINNITVTGNLIRSTQDGYGILAAIGTAADCTVSITGNVVDTTAGTNGHGIQVEKMWGAVVSGNAVRDAAQSGIRIVDSRDVVVSGNYVTKSDDDGIQVSNSPRCVITGNNCQDNNVGTGAGIGGIRILGASADDCIVSDNISGNPAGTGDQKHGIIIASGVNDTAVFGNNVSGNTTGGISDSGTDTVIRNNIGHLTENSGTSSVASGTTSIAVTHGLAITPVAQDISIAFTEQGTNDYGRWWISSITSTQFTLNVSADPGASNLDFGWKIQSI